MAINLLEGVPSIVRIFLVRALILFIIWKILYHAVLVPIRIPDKQLTDITAESTAVLYNKFVQKDNIAFKERDLKGTKVSVISVDNRKILSIADGCNGLELYVLYLGFLFCVPANAKRKLLFAGAGVVGIYIANSFRCFGLLWLYIHHFNFADFAHHYLFKMIIYSMIFVTWVKYSKKYFTHA